MHYTAHRLIQKDNRLVLWPPSVLGKWLNALNLTCPLISKEYVCTVVYVWVFGGGRSGESIRFISAAVRAMPSSKCCLKGKRAAVYVTECLCCSLQYGIAFTPSQSFDFWPVIRYISPWWSALVGGRVSGSARLIGMEPKMCVCVGGGWELNIHEERDQSTRRKNESEGIERKQICRNGTLWLLMPFIKLRCQADICRDLLSFLC